MLRSVRRFLRGALAAVNKRLQDPETSPPLEADVEPIRRFLLSLDQPDEPAAAYLREHLDRLAFTASFAPPAGVTARCLELGSYMHLAPALQQFRGYSSIRTADYGPLGSKAHKSASIAGQIILECDTDRFDAERDPFPYPADHFELVLACELLEHLRADPMHMIFEAFRVLQPQGRLLLTTPNCASFASLEQLLWRSANPYTYSLYPHPARQEQAASHIREYTPDELRRVLESAGFEVELLLTRPGRPIETRDLIEDLLLRYGFPTTLRGEQIYCLARKPGHQPQQDRFPSFLYG
ncbi:MAG: methyltransferase domain-containing protein [Bryobacteraceae bacterium]|nr:methyltransferase domain-containing protein [Bryobacteraceae bacterium]